MRLEIPTCAELRVTGMDVSGDAQIYPNFNDAIWVHCNMDDRDGDGITVIGGSRDGVVTLLSKFLE